MMWLSNMVVRFAHDERGGSAAEFALVVPFFLLLVFGTISVSILMSATTQMHYAAERAARCLAVSVAGNCSTANINTYAKGYYKGPPLTGLVFATSSLACGKQVTGSGAYALVSGFTFTNVNISARACYPLI